MFACAFGRGDRVASVVSFTGREQLSRPFRFDVMVSVPSREATRFPGDVLGGACALSLNTEATTRTVRGIVSRVALVQTDAERHLALRHSAGSPPLDARRTEEQPNLPGQIRP